MLSPFERTTIEINRGTLALTHPFTHEHIYAHFCRGFAHVVALNGTFDRTYYIIIVRIII